MQNCLNSLFGQIGRKLKAEGSAPPKSAPPSRRLRRPALRLAKEPALSGAKGLTTARPGLGSFVLLPLQYVDRSLMLTLELACQCHNAEPTFPT